MKDTPFDFSADKEIKDLEVEELLKYGILIDSGGFKKKEFNDVWSIFDEKAI